MWGKYQERESGATVVQTGSQKSKGVKTLLSELAVMNPSYFRYLILILLILMLSIKMWMMLWLFYKIRATLTDELLWLLLYCLVDCNQGSFCSHCIWPINGLPFLAPTYSPQFGMLGTQGMDLLSGREERKKTHQGVLFQYQQIQKCLIIPIPQKFAIFN